MLLFHFFFLSSFPFFLLLTTLGSFVRIRLLSRLFEPFNALPRQPFPFSFVLSQSVNCRSIACLTQTNGLSFSGMVRTRGFGRDGQERADQADLSNVTRTRTVPACLDFILSSPRRQTVSRPSFRRFLSYPPPAQPDERLYCQLFARKTLIAFGALFHSSPLIVLCPSSRIDVFTI